uniref:Venom protein n=1 Tax=Ampulex compressa TaxID=860918 RepID=A0A1W6EVP7_AMPCP|nr:venom protein [Ampulex compressa]
MMKRAIFLFAIALILASFIMPEIHGYELTRSFFDGVPNFNPYADKEVSFFLSYSL